jgi:hypothetical protein
MKQIGNIISFDVPEGASHFYISTVVDNLMYCIVNEEPKTIELPIPGSYTFICTNRDATEEQMKQCIKSMKHPIDTKDGETLIDVYYDYENKI